MSQVPSDLSPLPKPAIRAEHYLVCFLDLMGTSERLENIRHIHLMQDESAKAAALKLALGPTKHFRATCNDLVSQLNHTFLNPRPTMPGRDAWQTAVRAVTQLHAFGDTVILHLPLSHPSGIHPIKAVNSVFRCTALMVRSALSLKLPVRGAIDVGIAANVFEGECFGPVLADAARLEKSAVWPRVAIGNGAWEYLERLRRDQSPQVFSSLHRRTGEECARLCTKWKDQQLMLDFWGYAESQQKIEGQKRLRTNFARTLAWAKEESKSEKPRVSAAYAALADYLSSRAHLWK